MSSEIDFNAAVKPLQLLLKDFPNNYKGNKKLDCMCVCVCVCACVCVNVFVYVCVCV